MVSSVSRSTTSCRGRTYQRLRVYIPCPYTHPAPTHTPCPYTHTLPLHTHPAPTHTPPSERTYICVSTTSCRPTHHQHARARTCRHTHTFTYTHVHTHTHTHTHTHHPPSVSSPPQQHGGAAASLSMPIGAILQNGVGAAPLATRPSSHETIRPHVCMCVRARHRALPYGQSHVKSDR
jgi:hypothetical protein